MRYEQHAEPAKILNRRPHLKVADPIEIRPPGRLEHARWIGRVWWHAHGEESIAAVVLGGAALGIGVLFGIPAAVALVVGFVSAALWIGGAR